MRKFLAGLIVAIIVGAAGLYFGLPYYAQMQAERAVDATFDEARAGGANASHGAVQFEFSGKTLSIADISVKPTGTPAQTLTIGRAVATNVHQPDPQHITADRIELTDIEFATPNLAAGINVSYKAPKVVIEGYSGPLAPPSFTAPSDVVTAMRQALASMMAINAQSITVPNLVTRASASGNQPLGTFEYAYNDLVLRDIRGGRIAAASIDRATLTASGLPDGGKMTGQFSKMSMKDIDMTPFAAALDPRAPAGDRYTPVYKQVELGSVTITTDKAGEIRIGRTTLGEVAINPSKLKLAELFAIKDLLPVPGQQPTPEQTRVLVERMAGLYEGMHLGKFEMRDMTMNVAPSAPAKIAAVRISNLENGKFGEIAFEGFDGRTPADEPVHMGRLAIKGFDVAKLLRAAAQLGQGQPSRDQVYGMLACLEGVQFNDVEVVGKSMPRPVKIAAFDLSWGQFVGPLPSQAKLSAKVSTPIKAGESEPFFADLASAGVKVLDGSVDIALAWNESTQTLSLTPAVVDLSNTGVVSAKLQLQNVSRGMFTTDPVALLGAAATLEAGPVELSVRDAGMIDMALKQAAAAQGMTLESARTMVATLITSQSAQLAQGNPDVQAVADRLVEFINSRGSTLTITVAPKAHVNLMQSVELAKIDPMSLLPQFKFEAKVSK